MSVGLSVLLFPALVYSPVLLSVNLVFPAYSFVVKIKKKIAAKAILLYLSVIFKVFEKVNNANIVMLDDLARESARKFNL